MILKFFEQQPLPAHLQHIQTEIRARHELNQRLESCLPSFMQGAILASSIQAPNILITTHSAALASRLRMEQNKFIAIAQEIQPQITHCLINIAPPEVRFTDDQTLTLHREPPSPETQQAIAELAHTIDDEALKASLMHLLHTVQHGTSSVNDKVARQDSLRN